MTGAVLAIDGGNSKTDVALVGADGRLMSAVRGGASNHQTVGRAEALSVLRTLVRDAASQAGLPADGPVAAHTSACLAGADLPEEEEELRLVVSGEGWSASSSVVNDTFAVLRSGLDDAAETHWGIGVVCGTAMNCVAVAPGGDTTRFLALGSLSGDWGGGSDLGDAALWWAARAEDGRGPDTMLRALVPAHFRLASVHEVIVAIHRGEIGPADLAALSPVLLAAASEGDTVAADLVARQGAEVCVLAAAAAERLGLADLAVPVVLGGSVLTARHPLLTSAVTAGLAARLPRAVIGIADVPPVVGAALLGLDEVGAPPAAAARLRAALTGRHYGDGGWVVGSPAPATAQMSRG